MRLVVLLSLLLMTNDIKAIIVDDHPVVREGLKSSLEKFPGITVPGQAESGSELIKKLKKDCFDIILLDLNLTEKSGLEILEQLKTLNITTPVLIFSVYPEKNYAVRALKAGAKGYIHKQSNTTEIAGAIRKIASGKTYMSDTVQEIMRLNMLSEGKKVDPPHQNLSDREMEVLLLIYRRLSNKGIGEKLNISEKTVSTYRSRIYKKMGFSNDTELIKYVMRYKLDPTE